MRRSARSFCRATKLALHTRILGLNAGERARTPRAQLSGVPVYMVTQKLPFVIRPENRDCCPRLSHGRTGRWWRARSASVYNARSLDQAGMASSPRARRRTAPAHRQARARSIDRKEYRRKCQHTRLSSCALDDRFNHGSIQTILQPSECRHNLRRIRCGDGQHLDNAGGEASALEVGEPHRALNGFGVLGG
jgi:hypothetical protein